MAGHAKIDEFLTGGPFAVLGASQDRSKYGNKVLRVFLEHNKPVYAVNPRVDEVEGMKTFPDLTSIQESIHGISVITPPRVTEAIIEEAGKLGIRHVWLQPGAESDKAIERAEELGMNLIHSGPCILVSLGFRDR